MTEAHNGRLSWVIPLIVMIDLTLIGLFLFWAIVSHYDLKDSWIFGHPEFSMGEGQLTEQWGFVKLSIASTIMLILASIRRQTFFWGLSALLAVMLFSDGFELHEQINALIYPSLADSLDLKHVDLLTKLCLAGVPLSFILAGLYRSDAADRRQRLWLLTPVIALGFWVSIVDFLNSLFQQRFSAGRTIGNLIEEGGESLLITAILLSTVFCFREVFSATQDRLQKQVEI